MALASSALGLQSWRALLITDVGDEVEICTRNGREANGAQCVVSWQPIAVALHPLAQAQVIVIATDGPAGQPLVVRDDEEGVE